MAEHLEECTPCRIPVGRLSCDGGRINRHFMLMAGVGLDAHIVYNVNAALKNRIGKLAYWLAGWSLLGRRLGHFTVDSKASRHECSFALITKVRNYGGDFEIARNVSLLDDEFEVVLLEGRTTLPYVEYLPGMALNRLTGMKGVTVLRTSRVAVSCPQDSKTHVQIDGEFAGHLPAEIRIVPDAFTRPFHRNISAPRALPCWCGAIPDEESCAIVGNVGFYPSPAHTLCEKAMGSVE